MNTTTSTRHWFNDNGSICCEEHAGSYLTAAIEARPRAKSHRTPLGTWELMPADEVAEFLQYTEGKPVCETCRYR